MTETWKESMCNIKGKYLGKCLLASCCAWVGVGIVQGKTFRLRDRGRIGPYICSFTLCCFGAAYNRGKIRKFFKIKGSYFVDCLIYSTPLMCFACVQEYYEIKNREKSKFDNQMVIKDEPIFFPEDPVKPSPPASFRSMDFDDNFSIASFQQVPQILLSNEQNDENIPNSKRKNKKSLSSSSSSSSRPSYQQKSEPDPETPRRRYIPTEIAIVPLDGEDPLIYSQKIGSCPYSFLNGEPFNPKCPPPTYLSLEDLKKPKTTESKQILFGLEPHAKGGLICVDQEAIAKQKGVVGEVFKQVMANITKGLGAVSISLPVRIFEPRSTAERLVDRFSFAPVLLSKASKISDPVVRLLHVMAFNVSGLYLGSRQEKPFNPLLGETFEGNFPDGTKIYVEHTAHNPPTDHFDVIGQGYRMFGYYELDGSLGMNELKGEFRGFTHVQFPNQRITFTQPQFLLGGTMFGDRTLNWVGELEFKDMRNGLSAAIRIGEDRHKWAIKKRSMKKDDFIGKVWKTEGDKKVPVATVYGSWLKKFKFVFGDVKEKLWVIDQVLPVRHLPADYPLPSDWRYREDLIWLMRKNLEYAAGWKQRVETRQRLDRGLRGSKH